MLESADGKAKYDCSRSERKLDDENEVGREGGSEGFVNHSDLPKLLKFFVPEVIKVICEHIVATNCLLSDLL